MSQRTEAFLTSFNELEQFLRDTTNSDRNVPFGGLIGRSSDVNAAVRSYSRDLREWADLRNAVVHEHPRGQVIAEITPEALAEFQHIAGVIMAPPHVFPHFRRDVRVFEESDSLAEAVEDLWREGYSQVIVRQKRETDAAELRRNHPMDGRGHRGNGDRPGWRHRRRGTRVRGSRRHRICVPGGHNLRRPGAVSPVCGTARPATTHYW